MRAIRQRRAGVRDMPRCRADRRRPDPAHAMHSPMSSACPHADPAYTGARPALRLAIKG